MKWNLTYVTVEEAEDDGYEEALVVEEGKQSLHFRLAEITSNEFTSNKFTSNEFTSNEFTSNKIISNEQTPWELQWKSLNVIPGWCYQPFNLITLSGIYKLRARIEMALLSGDNKFWYFVTYFGRQDKSQINVLG